LEKEKGGKKKKSWNSLNSTLNHACLS